jgi:hypothetical protein
MDDEIQLAPALLDCLDDAINRGDVFHVAGYDEIRAGFCCQWFHPLAKRFALVGERKLCALGCQRL